MVETSVQTAQVSADDDLLPLDKAVWIEGFGGPVLVRHKSHIKRLTIEEGRNLVADPRAPILQAAPVQPSQEELEMRRRIEQLEAELAAAQAVKDFDAPKPRSQRG